MGRVLRYWLVKSEPEAYSIEDLERDQTTTWEGVRNYQARNFLRDDFRTGDRVLFYASNTEPPGVVGVAEVAREGYPDPFAFEADHTYFDPKSTREKPTWYTVDLKFVERFKEMVPLADLKATTGLEKMVVCQKGSRLSVQPVTPDEFKIVLRLGRRKTRKSARHSS